MVAAVDVSAWLFALRVLALMVLGIAAWTVPFIAAGDMARRGQSRILWWCVVFFLPILGIVAWLIARWTIDTVTERNP